MYTDRERKAYATKLRRNQTKLELRMSGLSWLGFRPQVVTPAKYVADYYNPYCHLIVEIDGKRWHDKRKDRARDAHHLKKRVYTIRLSEYMVSKHRVVCYCKVIYLGMVWTLVRPLVR
jgi:very-short-patch-repair endonuclease